MKRRAGFMRSAGLSCAFTAPVDVAGLLGHDYLTRFGIVARGHAIPLACRQQALGRRARNGSAAVTCRQRSALGADAQQKSCLPFCIPDTHHGLLVTNRRGGP